MTERKEGQVSRSEAAKPLLAEERTLNARESEAKRIASDSAKTARLRELRFAKEAAERKADAPAKVRTKKRRPKPA